MSDHELKKEVNETLLSAGAWEAAVVAPDHQEFQRVVENRHPLSIWPECKSIIVFAIASPAWVNNVYLGPRRRQMDAETRLSQYAPGVFSENHALRRLTDLVGMPVFQAGLDFLRNQGIQSRRGAFIPLKIAAVASGLTVYGRSGITVHPELGSRLTLGAILTEADLPPDKPLEDFHPCEHCHACTQACPGQAFETKKMYPENWDREKCTAAREVLATENIYCHSCRSVCPAGSLSDEELFGVAFASAHHEKILKRARPSNAILETGTD